jgi:hypothetical protein
LVAILVAGCFPKRNALIVRDDDLNPHGAQNQLELGPVRGWVGHRFYASASNEPESYYRDMGSGRKSWVIEHWGDPDEVFRDRGIEYHVYNKRSKQAPQYADQQARYVKLGYRHDKLVSIEVFFSNCPKAWQGPVHVLPK